MYEYVANLHVHSTYSDGTGTIEEIIAAARRAGIDVIGLTDHHTLGAFHDGLQGWHGKTLLVAGMENNKECNHYLSWGIEREIPDNTLNPQQVIDAVRGQGGIGFIAHPVEHGNTLVGLGNTFPWNDWNVSDFTGICIWNYSSQFRDGATTLPRAAYQAYINPHQKITGPYPELLKIWDELCADRRVVAIGGSDAHAMLVKVGPLNKVVFPYEFLFRCVNTHLLLKEPFSEEKEAAVRQFLNSLAEGSCFPAFDYYRHARGFRFWAEGKQGTVFMGQETVWQGPMKLRAVVPGKSRVRVIGNGRCCFETVSSELDYEIKGPGVYRLEVLRRHLRGWRPWIYSNPVYLR